MSWQLYAYKVENMARIQQINTLLIHALSNCCDINLMVRRLTSYTFILASWKKPAPQTRKQVFTPATSK